MVDIRRGEAQVVFCSSEAREVVGSGVGEGGRHCTMESRVRYDCMG